MSQRHWRGILVVVLAIRAVVVLRRRLAMRRGQRARQSKTRQPRTRVFAAAGISVLLAIGACSGEPSTSLRSRTPETVRASPSPAVTSPAHSSSDAVRYPNLSKFADPFDRYAYKSGYADCQFAGLNGMADAFGGDPSSPSSVARAYAAATFPESVEHREATFQGCLDAFESVR